MVQDQENSQAHSQELMWVITTTIAINIKKEAGSHILIATRVVTTTTQPTNLPGHPHTTTVHTDSKQIVRSFLKFKQINTFLNTHNFHSIYYNI